MDYGDLLQRMNTLRIGQTFVVETKTLRQQANQIAKAQGRIVATRKRKNKPGFTVTRLPE